MSAPASRSEILRIISGPSRHPYRPPRGRVDRFSILAELNVEFRGSLANLRTRRARRSCLAHGPHRFTGEDRLARRDADSTHAGQHYMIAIAGIKYQELTVGAERSRIEHIPVRWRGNDRAR